MLTSKDIINLYEIVEIKFYCKKQKDLRKGDYDPSLSQINIYLSNVNSEYERDITILHEFIHARNDENDFYDESDPECKNIDKEAIETYNKRPYIIKLIKFLYKI